MPIIKVKVEANHNLEGKSISIIVKDLVEVTIWWIFVFILLMLNLFLLSLQQLLRILQKCSLEIYILSVFGEWLSGSLLAFIYPFLTLVNFFGFCQLTTYASNVHFPMFPF
jgi:hypothetical protein